MKEVLVWAFLNNEFRPAGMLNYEAAGRLSKSQFRYFEQYISTPDAFPIDPIQLPLLDTTFETPQGFEIFNGIRDASPDRWGRYLLEKKYRDPLDELDYVTLNGPDRSGALAFSEEGANVQLENPIHLDLKLCADAAEDAMEGKDSQALQKYLSYGPSLGGARPKATVIWNDKPYIAKFTLSADKRNEALIEYATMSLAKSAGLNVPNLDRSKASNRDVFLIERFDRYDRYKPIPFMSGLTATGLHEQDYSLWSYDSLIDAINRFSPDPTRDRTELFRRMVFNILVNNSDDHMRNHGFIYVGNQRWALSPLYDVVPSSQISETYALSMRIGKYGKEASLENARSVAKYFVITPEQADEYIDQLVFNVKDWESHFNACGVSDQDLDKIRRSFRSF